MNNTDKIQIQAPMFELYELVTLYWNDSERPTKVVRRLFDVDDESWLYELAWDEQFYPEGAIETRSN